MPCLLLQHSNKHCRWLRCEHLEINKTSTHAHTRPQRVLLLLRLLRSPMHEHCARSINHTSAGKTRPAAR
eukprot:8607285-Alexandrium_andersonii.AAC.1